jgi:magnesium-protoporphyrin O-methyltransferase
MDCCQRQAGGANTFGEREARAELKRYRKKGPSKATRILLDALIREGVKDQTLLDIGGGVGTISLELLKSGVTSSTQIDASPAYVTASRMAAAEQGFADRFSCQGGDFVALAAETPAAGVVTLDRVICCYPNMPALVGQSAAKAARLYGAVYPRDAWWARGVGAVMNFTARLLRNPLRFFVYRTQAVDAVIRERGLAPRFQRNAGFWQVVVYARQPEREARAAAS